MATVDFLSPAYLEAIAADADNKKKYETPILNMFFARKVAAPNGFVKVPKEVFNFDDILPLISRGAAIKASELDTNRKYTTYELKLFGDLKILTPRDIKDLVVQLSGLTGTTYKAKKIELADSIIGEFNTKVNATREYMAGNAVLGSIKDKDGIVIETFNIPTANKLGDKNVGGGDTKVYQLLRAMKKQMSKATKYKGSVGIVIGSEAYDIISDTDEYQAWATSPVNNLTASEQAEGVEGFLGKKSYPFLVADDFYYDADGETQSFFSPSMIAMVPTGAFAEFYGTIDTNDGSFSKIKHIDKWETKNPDGTAYRLQCGSMPIVTLPNAIVTANVTSAV